MSKRPSFARSAGAVALLTYCVTGNALFTTPETELFSLSTSAFGFNVENDSTGPTTVTNDGPKNPSQTLTFDKFDTGLGTLLGVRVTWQSQESGTATLDVSYIGLDPITFFADASYTLSLEIPGTNLAASSIRNISPDCLLTPPASCSTSAGSSSAFNSAAPLALTPLSAFLGPGTFGLTVMLASAIDPRIDPDNGTNFADNATMQGRLSNTWSGNVSIQYEYQERTTAAIPEPMTLYLLLAGAAGIALLRRRLS